MSEDFQRVLALTCKIPKGKVSTYKELARILHLHPRTVAQALSCNEHPIVIPCHRVVHSDGRIGGYTPRGSKEKIRLLHKEGVQVINDRINSSYFHLF